MLPELPLCLETGHTVKMLAIIKQWEASGSHTDNVCKYLLLLLFKFGLDAGVFYCCCQKWNTSFLRMCSLSITLVDLVMVFLMASMWFLGAEKSFMSPCFLLANASATYGAVPLPMICLGLLDYCLNDTCISSYTPLCKFVKNLVMTWLVWSVAVIHSFGSVNTDLMELDYAAGIKALVCDVEESTLICYITLGLFAAILCPMVLFWSRIAGWVKEADSLSEAREEQENERSDLLFTSSPCMETKTGEVDYLEETSQPRPPLWFSLMLGFGIFWMPYLVLSVACMVCGFAVPSYISVNLLWLECTNSVLAGLVFWIKSRTLGPYSHLPENVCLWHIYWHLSHGMQQQPIAVFNPSKGKKNTSFYV